MKLVSHHHKSIHFLAGKSVHHRPTLHMQPLTHAPIQMSCLAKNASNLILHLLQVRYYFLHQNQMQLSLQQSKDNVPTDVVTQHLQQQTLNQSQLNDTSGSILNNQ